MKERFSKKYRHPTLDAALTKKRLSQVSLVSHGIFKRHADAFTVFGACMSGLVHK